MKVNMGRFYLLIAGFGKTRFLSGTGQNGEEEHADSQSIHFN